MSEAQQSHNELVLGSVTEDTNCLEMFSSESLDSTKSVHISLLRSPDEIVREWAEEFDKPPGAMHILCSSERRSTRQSILEDGRIEVSFVSPSDMTGMSIFLCDSLEKSSGDMETSLCFEGVETMMNYAGEDKLHRFLNAVCSMSHDFNVSSHFHLNEKMVGGGTVSTFETLFDSVVRSG